MDFVLKNEFLYEEKYTICEGWYYLTSYSNIISDFGVYSSGNLFFYKPGHANEALVRATDYDIKCENFIAIPKGKRALVKLISYSINKPNSKWSIKLLKD